jgi:bacterioferritin (cytochrome b1)
MKVTDRLRDKTTKDIMGEIKYDKEGHIPQIRRNGSSKTHV